MPDSNAETGDAATAVAAGGAGSRVLRRAAQPAARRERDTAPPRPPRGWPRLAGWLVVAVPALTAFLVGGYRLGGASLWRDEAYTRDAIDRSFGQIFTLLGHQDAVHGAYYLLMHPVAAAIGTSATALRFPSLVAMAVAAAFTAAAGRRAAALAQARDGAGLPAACGLAGGMVFATAPLMTYYAQTARSYAIETMFAVIASYLLLRACPDGRWRWWAAYGAAVALCGLFNLFGLLILAAHGMTLLLADPRRMAGAAAGRRLGRVPVRWLAAAAAAVIVLGPLLRVAYRERKQIAWLGRPDFATVDALIRGFAGSRDLILPVTVLALCGIAAACLADDWRPLNPAALALPWLVVPPVLLIAVSFAKPVYDQRYVEFCLPALAILVGSGLTGLVRLGRRLRVTRPAAAWAPSAAAAVAVLGLAVLLVAPQRAIRQTSARPDNLRLASAIVAANERPGDVVFYIPANMRVLGTGYPAPFRRLRDIALARSPVASGTLTGTETDVPAVLKSRFTDVRRVWVVTGNGNGTFPVPSTPVDREKMALLAGMHILHRWRAGDVMLTLYGY
ncbi:MAG TPA: glycosyltransferase family 39 protein [Streptosporangiaceae bacterium]|nr:glycosyltransferase family 39 protein [Streptosporangiaceae bacterium]